MELLPFRTALLLSDLTPQALADALHQVIGDGPAAPFAGAVADGAFSITSLREYRAASMPVLSGRLTAAPGGGTAVRLRLRPPGIVFVFMGIWLGFLAAVAALILLARARDPGRGLLPLAAPAGLAVLSWFLMTSVFAAEARWAVVRLLEAVPGLRRGEP